MLLDMTVLATTLVASVGVKRVNQLCMMLSSAKTPGERASQRGAKLVDWDYDLNSGDCILESLKVETLVLTLLYTLF